MLGDAQGIINLLPFKVINPQHKEIVSYDSLGGYASLLKKPLGFVIQFLKVTFFFVSLMSVYLQDLVGPDLADMFEFQTYIYIERVRLIHLLHISFSLQC